MLTHAGSQPSQAHTSRSRAAWTSIGEPSSVLGQLSSVVVSLVVLTIVLVRATDLGPSAVWVAPLVGLAAVLLHSAGRPVRRSVRGS